MKLKITLFTFFVFLHLMFIGQKQSVRIGPPCPKQQYEPLFVIDGIRIPPSVGSKFMDEKKETIDSLSLQPDSIFDCNGKVTNFGIVRIFTKDSINTGAKKIQFLTDYYLN
ncbi:MAG TPA: hypothetical protein PK252_04750 [Bacteroidales bacterium]|nr:hypothetical protein [Bacteroidales bacterium]